jgi:ketosteroid isomerase-like protein
MCELFAWALDCHAEEQPLKRRLFTVTALLSLAWPAAAQSQSCTVPVQQPVPAWQADEIARLNTDMASARTAGDVSRLLTHFAPDSVIMPEHQQRLFGTEQGEAYYRSLFSRLDITRYAAETQDILAVPEGALEWGTLALDYAPMAGGAAHTAEGKYMHLWRRQPNGTLKLKAEIWGFLAPLGEAASHWLVDAPAAAPPATGGDPALRAELEALNAAASEAVASHSTSRIDEYAQDAVYLPFADRPQVGLAAIRAHLVPYIEAGRGATFDRVRIWNDGFEESGGYVVEYSNFEVQWRAGEASGVTSGNGLRLLRREEDCSLKLLRQAGTHHRP